ncbi:hypothetical protein GGI24_002170, partial [Coemansia furcata]
MRPPHVVQLLRGSRRLTAANKAAAATVARVCSTRYIHDTTRPSTSTAKEPNAGKEQSTTNENGQVEKWNADKRIAIERQPFHKLPVARLETADFVPRLRTLEKALSMVNLQIPPEKLMQIVTQFLLANRARRDVHVELEKWRQDVLDAFNGDLKEITRAAGVFAKLSPKKFLAHALYKVAAEEGYQNAAHHYAVIMGTGSVG